MNVDNVQQSRPQWRYTPVLQFFHRMIVQSLIDAETALPSDWISSARSQGIEGPAPMPSPTDDALLARDWFATSEPGVRGSHDFVSFPECCWALDLNPDSERVQVLAWLDGLIDFDTEDAWKRLERLQAQPIEEAHFPVPEWARVVPVLDQMCFFSLAVAV